MHKTLKYKQLEKLFTKFTCKGKSEHFYEVCSVFLLLVEILAQLFSNSQELMLFHSLTFTS